MKVDTNVLFGKRVHSEQDCSIGKVTGLLERHHIDKALVASTMGALFDDVSGNDDTLEVCRGNRNFFPVGTINIHKYMDVEREIALRKGQGFKAFRLFNEYGAVDFDGIVFKSFLRILERYKMPLIVKGVDADLRSYAGKIAYAVSDTGISVIIIDVSGYSLADTIEAAKFADNIFFSTRLFTTTRSIELFCEEVSPKRLVFGSGIPFYYGNQSILRIETADIDNSVKEDIFSNNIMGILEGML